MSIILNQTELAQLDALRTQAQGGAGYWHAYAYLVELLDSRVASSDPVLLWLKGATEANAGRGALSALIRAFTSMQYRLRYNEVLPEGAGGPMQLASDAVAQAVLRDVFGEAEGSVLGVIPTLDRIAANDATAVGDVLFRRDANDTASTQNAAWSGTLLFSLFNSNQGFRLMSTGDGESVDTLNDWRDALFAYASFNAGLAAAARQIDINAVVDPIQNLRDASILGATWGGFPSQNSWTSFTTALLAR